MKKRNDGCVSPADKCGQVPNNSVGLKSLWRLVTDPLRTCMNNLMKNEVWLFIAGKKYTFLLTGVIRFVGALIN